MSGYDFVLTHCLLIAVCPDIVQSDDRCEDVSASMGLVLDGDSLDTSTIRAAFEADLSEAIASGRLQTILEQIAPDSPIYIVTLANEQEDDDTDEINKDDSSDGISGGAISGIVIGGMAGIILTMALLSRRRQNEENDEYFLKENQSADVEELMPAEKMESTTPQEIEPESNIEVGVSEEAESSDAVTTAAAIGAGVAVMRPPRSKKADQSMEKDSDAGSSGWSSREGLSSLEESSNADQESKASDAASSTPSITPSLPREDTLESADPDGAGLHLTYSELDQAIQKGDWAAVGVTAALLASQSNADSLSSPEKKVNFTGDLPPNKAAELDRLVEAGDWAGVVAAAAKFDAQESQQGSVGSVRSDHGSSAGSVFSGSGTAPTIGSGAFTTGTSNSDSGSRVKKLDELRAEVEMLVEKVVPEEKDNIEEMMMQFRGREEELVETLRTMQEREVALKARLEGQKRAKRDARQAVEQNKLQHKGAPGDVVGPPADENWIHEIENTPSDPEIVVSTSQEEIDTIEAPQGDEDEDKEVLAMQDALKLAIESEDWDKVAEAAAGLSGRFADDAGANIDDNDDSTKSSDHSAEINELVEKGDWDGVVAVASKQSEHEQSVSSDTREEEARRLRREQRLQEEHEALQQADIWRAIAEQTKSENAEAEAEANRAATVAADWAIARSLSELRAADKAGKLSDIEKDSDTSSGDDDQDATI